jgi:hypothetical protein
MNYWFTTHWPPPDEEGPEDYLGVWVKDEKKHIIKKVHKEDLVWIYEFSSGKAIVQRNGKKGNFKRRQGRQGVIGLVKVIDTPSQDKSKDDIYSDGTSALWSWYAPTKPISLKGFIPRQKAAQLLGHKEKYLFRIFGGLKEIDEISHRRLLKEFNIS